MSTLLARKTIAILKTQINKLIGNKTIPANHLVKKGMGQSSCPFYFTNYFSFLNQQPLDKKEEPHSSKS